ncbi:MAG: LemA family protein [Minisyncoccia bacterium]
MTLLILLVVIILIILLWPIFTFNSLIKLRNQCREALSDINIQLKRRYDLIPNLVETVKGYAFHEKDLFEKVTQARSAAMSAQTLKEKAQAENVLSDTLKTLFAVVENYPELKANQNFLELQRELIDTEDKIQAARRFYNGNVRDYNTKIQTFPSTIIASIFSFKEMEFFGIEEKETEVPKVNF